MPSTNETKVTTNELNSDGKDATETQERHWDFLHGCWKYGPRKFNGWDFRYRVEQTTDSVIMRRFK